MRAKKRAKPARKATKPTATKGRAKSPPAKAGKGKITAAVAATIDSLPEASLLEVARRVREAHGVDLTESAVSRHRARALAAGTGIAGPAVEQLEQLTTIDRAERQLATLDQVLALGNLSPATRTRTLIAYTTIVERIDKIRRKSESGNKAIDGVAGLMKLAAQRDEELRATSPAEWLLDAVPRALPRLRALVSALGSVAPVSRPDLHDLATKLVDLTR